MTALTTRGRARRDHVLADLRELFLAEGFADFTIADLAARLRCSRTTLYLVASSKEQIVTATVRSYFREATAAVEERISGEPDPGRRIAAYLDAVAAELQPASAAFHRDVAAFPPAQEIYEQNTTYAAGRVRAFIDEGVAAGTLRQVDTSFVADLVGVVMTAIQSGRLGGATGDDDAKAYRHLSDLLLHGLSR